MAEKSPKISIIVPVYNAEKTLNKCMDSIISQSFTDWELLLVDDGSTDGSGVLCDEYAAKDSRIRVFHRANGGVSSARNLGLDNASGNWLMFVDSDDCLCSDLPDPDSYCSDLVMFSFNDILPNTSSVFVLPDIDTGKSKSGTDEPDCHRLIDKYLDTAILRSPWAKYYNRELVGALRFDEKIKVGEDRLFNFEYLGRVSHICTSSLVVYDYYDAYESFWEKYAQSIDRSEYAISRLLPAYMKLGVRCPAAERAIFCDFKALCQTDIYRNPSRWYSSPVIRDAYRYVKRNFSLSYRLRYALLSVPLISKIHSLLNINKESCLVRQLSSGRKTASERTLIQA